MNPAPELSIAALCKRGELPRAAAALFASHGTEVFAFLTAFMDEDAAWVMFGAVQEQAMAELLTVDAEHTSFRTWLFGLAHRAHARSESGPESLAVSSRAASSQPKSGPRMKAGFDQLPLDDRHLLVLRLDRGLRFDEIAEVLYGTTADERRRRAWADTLAERCSALQAELTSHAV